MQARRFVPTDVGTVVNRFSRTTRPIRGLRIHRSNGGCLDPFSGAKSEWVPLLQGLWSLFRSAFSTPKRGQPRAGCQARSLGSIPKWPRGCRAHGALRSLRADRYQGG